MRGMSFGYERIVRHIRFIPDEDVGDYYAAADLVVLPYRKIYQSAVLLMALSHGRAVLVSDLPGMTDIVEHGRNGWVFREGDVADLEEKLGELLADGERLEYLGPSPEDDESERILLILADGSEFFADINLRTCALKFIESAPPSRTSP